MNTKIQMKFLFWLLKEMKIGKYGKYEKLL